MTFDPAGSPTAATGVERSPVAPEAEPVALADVVVAAVTGVPGVAAMHPGMFGEVATYLPGRKVVGVQIRPDVANIDVVVDWGVSVPATAEQVRQMVEVLVGTPVHVTVQDMAEPRVPAQR